MANSHFDDQSHTHAFHTLHLSHEEWPFNKQLCNSLNTPFSQSTLSLLCSPLVCTWLLSYRTFHAQSPLGKPKKLTMKEEKVLACIRRR